MPLYLILSLFLSYNAYVDAEQPAIPQLAGKTPYGEFTQRGRVLTHCGHVWSATGFIRADGLVELAWQHAGKQGTAPGLYAFADGRLTGYWGWSARIEGAGITGDTCEETISVSRE